MGDCWLIHPAAEAQERWRQAVPELTVRERLEPCVGARVLILGNADWLGEAREFGVPLVVISSGDPGPLYEAGARSVIEEPQTPEQCQAVVRYWCEHNVA